jgi:hypothetical protein
VRERTAGTRAGAGLLAFAASLALAFSACAGQASAVIVQVQGRSLSYQPAPGARAQPLTRGATKNRSAPGGAKANSKSPLIYHKGGSVMPSNTNYTLYWDPASAPEYPAGYQAGIDRYFEDLAHDSGGQLNSDSLLTQYYGNAGEFANYDSHFGGALIDTNPYPPSGCTAAPTCLTDAQIRTEILGYVEAHKLPIDLQHQYFLLTPQGVESCMEAASKSCSAGSTHRVYCAYHGFIPSGPTGLIYADDPYVDGLGCDVGEEHPNGNASDATIAGGLAHEHSESVTDPRLNAWYDAKGNEVADKCRTLKASTEYGEPLGKAPNGSSYNELIDGDLYLYQQMWSNAAGQCLQRLLQLPSVTKVKPKTGSPAGGTSVTILGSGFAAPATVHFGGAAASEVVVNSATSITAVAPAGSPSTTVDVTVTTSAGTSAITAKDHFKYKSH